MTDKEILQGIDKLEDGIPFDEIRNGDKIFKYLFKQKQEMKCFWVQTNKGMVLVDCARIDGAFGIIEGQTEWVGNRVACANRLALMGADLDKTF